jgi:hypothetical protein
VEGIELVSSFPFSSFFVQPVDRCSILVAVRQRDQFRWFMGVFFEMRDIVRLSLVIVFPVGEQRMALTSAAARY